jgi:large subunit ribosomal protein L35
MPKLKTKSSARKRFKKTATGKIKRAKAYKSHLLSHKTRKRKRNLRKAAYLKKADLERIARLIPYQ